MIATCRRLPCELWSASSPPGPRLLLRDFLSLVAGFELLAKAWALSSAVEFSLSKPDVIFDRGT